MTVKYAAGLDRRVLPPIHTALTHLAETMDYDVIITSMRRQGGGAHGRGLGVDFQPTHAPRSLRANEELAVVLQADDDFELRVEIHENRGYERGGEVPLDDRRWHIHATATGPKHERGIPVMEWLPDRPKGKDFRIAAWVHGDAGGVIGRDGDAARRLAVYDPQWRAPGPRLTTRDDLYEVAHGAPRPVVCTAPPARRLRTATHADPEITVYPASHRLDISAFHAAGVGAAPGVRHVHFPLMRVVDAADPTPPTGVPSMKAIEYLRHGYLPSANPLPATTTVLVIWDCDQVLTGPGVHLIEGQPLRGAITTFGTKVVPHLASWPVLGDASLLRLTAFLGAASHFGDEAANGMGDMMPVLLIASSEPIDLIHEVMRQGDPLLNIADYMGGRHHHLYLNGGRQQSVTRTASLQVKLTEIAAALGDTVETVGLDATIPAVTGQLLQRGARTAEVRVNINQITRFARVIERAGRTAHRSV